MGLARESDTSASLLLRIRDSEDSEAWTTFLAVYSPLIRRYCGKKGLQTADAVDVTQEVLAKVAQAIRAFEYRPERGRFRSWLGTIIAHEIARYHARNKTQPLLIDPVDADELWNHDFTQHILAVALDRVRGEFATDTWDAFQATWLHDEAPTHVAKRLKIAIHAVYVNKSRVLKRLEAEVRILAEDGPLLPD